MEEEATSASTLQAFIEHWTVSEIPAFYYLLERFALLAGLVLFASAVYSIYRVRSITGNASMSSMSTAEVSMLEVGSKFIASVFLASFGVGQSMISNTVFLGDFDPYSIDVLRSISCSVSDMKGCLHYELGMFTKDSLSSLSMNKSFFEFFTSIVVVSGTIFYTLGWLSFAKAGRQDGRQKTLGQCCLQILLGAMMMRPVELWQLVSGSGNG